MSVSDISLPNVDTEQLKAPSIQDFDLSGSNHKPRILLLYGSLRERSYSRLASEEAARILNVLGAETKLFNPADLPRQTHSG